MLMIKDIEYNPDIKLRDLKQMYILSALKKSEGNLTEASRMLGVGRATIYRYAKKFGFIKEKNIK